MPNRWRRPSPNELIAYEWSDSIQGDVHSSESAEHTDVWSQDLNGTLNLETRGKTMQSQYNNVINP